jgi:hypothetical protein
MIVVIISVVLLVTACASPIARTTNPTGNSDNLSPTSVSVTAPTQVPAEVNPASNTTDACTLLTKDDVSQVLGVPVDTAVASGLGGVCTYTSANLSITFTIAGHTGGIQAMNTTLANLGDLALVVPGLGDQAFYNTNSANALFLLKGDAEYLFGMSDVNYQPLDPAVVQATEKAFAVQLLSHLP